MAGHMLRDQEREAISRLWRRKLDQDAQGLPQAQRHRNLEPASAELLCALCAGVQARRIVEIGGSSGLSTIARAAAARATGGQVLSIEVEPVRQQESRATIAQLGLSEQVEFRLGDAAEVLPGCESLELVFIDCEKYDYIRFFDMLRLAPGATVVADNIVSHGLLDYVAHVRRQPRTESITLPVGKGLEISRVGLPAA
jgi:predicted O-methyltransferase YrrM